MIAMHDVSILEKFGMLGVSSQALSGFRQHVWHGK